nr:MAG TPA: hypothetical protein [Caudoviricetes sp.]
MQDTNVTSMSLRETTSPTANSVFCGAVDPFPPFAPVSPTFSGEFPPSAVPIMPIAINTAITISTTGFFCLAPQAGQTFADFAISAPQVLHLVILSVFFRPPRSFLWFVYSTT